MANSGAVVRQLLDGIGSRDVSKGEAFRSEAAAMKQQIYDRLKETWGNELRAFEAIRGALPEDTIFSLDPTVPASRAIRCLNINRPRTFMYPHGWLGLGFAFPAAMGAKLGRPQSPVVCVTGDGGFQYNLQELATAAQYGISPIILMFNDNAWGVLKDYQKQMFDSRLFATDLVNPDFVKLFDSYGFEGVKVSTVAELTRALENAQSANSVRLIEVQIPNGFAAFV